VGRIGRSATIERHTAETEISLTLDLEGSGKGQRESGIGFFDHMLDLLAYHGRLDLEVVAKGDLQTGSHHTVEDVGICFGQALSKALGERKGVARFGAATVPMDEARSAVAIDLSGRPLLVFEGAVPPGRTGEFENELCEEFLRAVAGTARITLHVRLEAGRNAHHMIEATFKAFALALRQAVAIEAGREEVPSTKGTLGG